jgi:hypothetical protein
MTDERSEAASSSVPLDPPVGLDALELQMYREYTEKRTTYCEDMPGAHTVWLRVGVQQFCLSGVRESADEADWMRAMLAKALARLVHVTHNAEVQAASKASRAEIALGLAGMVIAERDDLSAAFELGRQAGLDEASKHTSVQVALPERPDPEDCEHLSFDAYSGSQMLAYGRVCAEAQRMMSNDQGKGRE